MAVNSLVSSFYELLQGRLIYLISHFCNTRAKKLFWLIGFGMIFIMYFSSSKFILPHRHLQVKHGGHRPSPRCLESVLEKWYMLMETADAVVKHIPSDSVDQEFLPFLGNGFIGLTVERGNMELYILNDTKMGLFKIPFPKFVEFRPMGESTDPDETLVLDLKTGEIHLFTTFNGDILDNCVVVEHTIYVHREIPGALVQEIEVNNLRPVAIHGRFEVKKINDWKEHIFKGQDNKKSRGFSVSQGLVTGTEANSEKILAIASSLFAKEMKIAHFSTTKISVNMAIREVDSLPQALSSTASASERQNLVETRSKKLIEDVKKDWLSMQKLSLYEMQKQAWKKIWKLGIRIDSKDDPDAPSPLNVNMTEYYLYSIGSLTSNNSVTTGIGSSVGTCFHGSPTMHSAQFWVLPQSIDGLVSLAEKWKTSLYDYGCEDLVLRGLFGLQKAIVLSFSGLQFTTHGLELALNPNSLFSNISLRQIPYKKNALHLNIRINPPDGIKTIEIHLDNTKDADVFACGSACEQIVKISNAPSVFIAKLTNPVTPILYVSSNRTDLEVINKSSFIKKAVQESDNEHPRFAAHHFTIPAKFWFAVIFCIVLFHVIVIKMIYTECLKERTGKRTKKRGFKT